MILIIPKRSWKVMTTDLRKMKNWKRICLTMVISLKRPFRTKMKRKMSRRDRLWSLN